MPKEGPSPGEYEPTIQEKKSEITSCFKSKNDRFSKAETVIIFEALSRLKFNFSKLKINLNKGCARSRHL